MCMTQRLDPTQHLHTAGLCRRNALHVAQLAWTTHPAVGFDLAGVRWLDRHIEKSRPHLPAGYLDEFVQLMGCFYGECILAAFGGQWMMSHDDRGHLGIETPGLGVTFPIRAVEAHVVDGAKWSVAVAYLTATEYVGGLASLDASVVEVAA